MSNRVGFSFFRFLKYSDGQYFKPHYDGTYTRPDGSETSYITIQVVIEVSGVDVIVCHNTESPHQLFLCFLGKKYLLQNLAAYCSFTKKNQHMHIWDPK